MTRGKFTHSIAIKWIIQEYFEQIYAHRFNNLDEIDQFLDKNHQPKLTQGEKEKLNRLIPIKEIASKNE